MKKVIKSESEWQSELSPEAFQVCRKKGTEHPFTGKYWDNKNPATYTCACCGLELFSSTTKFDSGTGWPSFWQPINAEHVTEESDASLGTVRTEVLCARCDAHLGHVFDDGPNPSGKRFCINSVSLEMEEPDIDESKDS